MGNTCAGIHIQWSGGIDDAVKAITRSYAKLGYRRLKKRSAESNKHVVLHNDDQAYFLSVADSDSGELKDLALHLSKALKTTAVFTSLTDSDAYEFIVFSNGRQIDFLMTDAEAYEGPMKQLSGKSRASKWTSLFGRPFAAGEIEAAAATPSVFADDALGALAELIGLAPSQPQANYLDFVDGAARRASELYFERDPAHQPSVPAGEIRLANYFDPDNCRMRSVYPASWPVPLGRSRLATWLLLSQGAGFEGGTLKLLVTGSDSISIARATIAGFKFHNGQIVGALHPEDPAEPTNVSLEPAGERLFKGSFPHLKIPPMTPERTTQILLVLQVQLEPLAPGEWEIAVSVQPSPEYNYDAPPLRIAALEQTWVPVVSGLSPKTVYDKGNIESAHLRELEYKQAQVPLQRELDHPAVTSSVAILEDCGQPTLDACKSWLEAWLAPLTKRQDGEFRIVAEKQMTESAYVGKTKKTLPAAELLKDKIWSKLFDAANNYQTVLVTYSPPNAECPIAGIGLQHGISQAALGGQSFPPAEPDETWHASKWVINHPDLQTSIADMQRDLDRFAGEHSPLQAWFSQNAWIPLFDRADSWERTVYEESSVLNWFRDGLDQLKMTERWCRKTLRMVSPHMWLCRELMDRLDRPSLERVAHVTESEGACKIALRAECRIDELELALLPILPVESARIALR